VPVVVLVLLVKGCATSSHQPADAFLVGSGVRGTATVEARVPNGAWIECDYERIRGEYDCPGLATVTDVTANLVSDAPPSWPFISPAVQASAYGPHVEVRIRRGMRLAGRYWAGSSHPATIAIGGREEALPARTTETFELDDGEREVVWQAEIPFPQAVDMTLVRTEAIDPPRPYLVPPPEQPPAKM
jgi:hypothetical protein